MLECFRVGEKTFVRSCVNEKTCDCSCVNEKTCDCFCVYEKTCASVEMRTLWLKWMPRTEKAVTVIESYLNFAGGKPNRVECLYLNYVENTGELYSTLYLELF
jgi:hypothetical protein